jgi:hypothetical protein
MDGQRTHADLGGLGGEVQVYHVQCSRAGRFVVTQRLLGRVQLKPSHLPALFVRSRVSRAYHHHHHDYTTAAAAWAWRTERSYLANGTTLPYPPHEQVLIFCSSHEEAATHHTRRRFQAHQARATCFFFFFICNLFVLNI